MECVKCERVTPAAVDGLQERESGNTSADRHALVVAFRACRSPALGRVLFNSNCEKGALDLHPGNALNLMSSLLYADIRKKMHEIAGTRPRFGYRRVGILLEREGFTMNEKKLYRLYKEEGLSVRRRCGRKRARGTRVPMPIPNRPNVRWSLDFVSDTFGASRKFRILAVNDDCTRENLGLIADTSLSGARVARELTAMIRIYGKPDCIVSDNGTEFTSTAILKCPHGD